MNVSSTLVIRPKTCSSIFGLQIHYQPHPCSTAKHHSVYFLSQSYVPVYALIDKSKLNTLYTNVAATKYTSKKYTDKTRAFFCIVRTTDFSFTPCSDLRTRIRGVSICKTHMFNMHNNKTHSKYLPITSNVALFRLCFTGRKLALCFLNKVWFKVWQHKMHVQCAAANASFALENSKFSLL